MSEEKVVKFDLAVAKKKINEAREKAISTTSERLKTAQASIKEKVESRKEIALSAVLDKGLELTKKQLKLIEGLRKKHKKS